MSSTSIFGIKKAGVRSKCEYQREGPNEIIAYGVSPIYGDRSVGCVVDLDAKDGDGNDIDEEDDCREHNRQDGEAKSEERSNSSSPTFPANEDKEGREERQEGKAGRWMNVWETCVMILSVKCGKDMQCLRNGI